MKIKGMIIKEYMLPVPKEASELDIIYACDMIAETLQQLATIKAMLDADKRG